MKDMFSQTFMTFIEWTYVIEQDRDIFGDQMK